MTSREQQQLDVMEDDSIRDTQQDHDDNETPKTTRAPSTITLDPNDYVGWSLQMQVLLEYHRLWDLVKPISSTAASSSSSSSSSSSVSLASSTILARTREAHYILVSALRDVNTRRVLIGLPSGDPRALWQALHNRFTSLPKAATAALFAQLISLRQSSSESAQSFADRIILLRNQLLNNGRKVDDIDVITTLVNGVTSSLAQQVNSYYNCLPNSTFEQIVGVAKGEEARLLSAAASSKPHSSHSNNNSALAASFRSSSSSSSAVKCHHCGSNDHFVNGCPARRASNTASQQEIDGGACPRPGHRNHKATDCRSMKRGRGPVTAATASSNINPQSNPTSSSSSSIIKTIPMGSAEVSIRSVSSEVGVNAATTQQKSAVLDSGAGRTMISSSGTLLDSTHAPDILITVANGEMLSSPMSGTAVINVAGSTQLHVKDALQHSQVDRTLLSVSSVLNDNTKVERVVFLKDGAAAFTPAGDILFTASKVNGIYVVDTDSQQSETTARVFAAAAESSSPSSDTSSSSTASTTSIIKSSNTDSLADLLHQRFCHRSFDGIRQLQTAGAVNGLQLVKVSSKLHHSCIACAQGKAHRQSFSDRVNPQLQPTASHLLARVHADVAGPLSIESVRGYRYFLIILDEFSEFGFVAFLRQKSDAASIIIDWCREAATRHGREVVEFHSDGGGEFINDRLAKFFRQKGTLQSSTPAHTPQHNGKAERIIRTITNWASAILLHSNTKKEFWPHAISTAMYTRNLTQVCKSGDQSLTPYARWFGITGPTPVDHLRVFGCDADVLFTKASGSKLSKLSSKSRRCMFIGYDTKRNNVWLFYDSSTLEVFSSRDATFHEHQFTISNSLHESTASDDSHELDDDTTWLTKSAFDGETKLMQIISKEEAESKAASIPSNNSPDSIESSDSISSSSSENDSDSESDSSSSDPPSPSSSSSSSSPRRIPSPANRVGRSRQSRPKGQLPTRRTTRINAGIKENKYGMTNGNLAQARYVYIGLTDADHPVPDQLFESLPKSAQLPRKYADAIENPEWKAALLKELEAHEKNGTWRFVLLPTGAKAIGCKYVFRIKLKSDGTIDRYKVRLTAQGFGQRDGRDYHENAIYAPVLSYQTLRIILAFICAQNYELYHLDVQTAFLNASVEEDIYMRVPDGVSAPEGTVCKLEKALYGIKQAPHAWHADIAATLTSTLGFHPSTNDPCLFLKVSRTCHMMLLPLFVDDCFPACHVEDKVEMREILNKLMTVYDITDNGDAELILGMRVTRDRSNHILKLDQQVFIERLLADYNATNCKPSSTPSSNSTESDSSDIDDTTPATESERVSYQALTGSYQYLNISGRPDMGFLANDMSRHLINPTRKDCKKGWRALRYLRGTTDLGITFSGSKISRTLVAYSDANWAGLGEENARSTSGWILKIGSGPIAWSSKKQDMTALSATESEYISATLAALQIVWTRRILTDCGIKLTKPTPLICDNRAAIQLASTRKVSQRTKHINVRYHKIRELIEDGEITMSWIRSEDQPADLFTKPLGPHIFLRLRPIIMGTEHNDNNQQQEL